MGPTPGSSIRGVGGTDSNSIGLDGLGNRLLVSFNESKFAICLIDYLVDVWVPGEVI